MRFFGSIAFLCAASASLAQPANPGNGRIFSLEEIPEVHILIDSDSLEALYDPGDGNWWSNHEYPATFVWSDSFSSDTLYDIGFRFRGNTARDKAKKSFKVSFNTYVQGRRYHGLKKLNLNAETNDPSMLRSYAAWRMYRELEIPASRSNHVKVYINGAYHGLYQNCEHINDDWVKLRFADDNGNLYKCSYPADLNYISENPDDYKATPPWKDERIYEIKTNREADDYSDLASFIGFVNNADPETFGCEFQHHFNVYRYLKTLAIDVLTGNWDGYLYNQNNYYLYYHPRRGRFEYLPYDLDNTWGIDWMGIDWALRNPFHYAPAAHYMPLYERLMAHEAYRDIFAWYLRSISTQYFDGSALPTDFAERQLAITQAALEDPFRSLDFGFGDAQFLNALHSASGGHVAYGILPFVEARRNAVFNQVASFQIAPVIWEVEEDFAQYPGQLRFRVRTDGPPSNMKILHYRINGGPQLSVVIDADESLTDFVLPLPTDAYMLEYNIAALGVDGLQREAYCTPRELLFGNTEGTLVINEAMSVNHSTIADEAGEYDDWIELYNPSSGTIDLGAYFLSDKHNGPRYWPLPQMTVAAGGFALVWADGQPEQGAFHANFGLNASGERVYLFRKTGNGLHLVDYTDIPPMNPDISWGRSTDAGLPWVVFDAPTPAASNNPLHTDDGVHQASYNLPYPNPSATTWAWHGERHYTLYDLQGRLMGQGYGEKVRLQVQLARGTYILHLEGNVHRVVVN